MVFLGLATSRSRLQQSMTVQILNDDAWFMSIALTGPATVSIGTSGDAPSGLRPQPRSGAAW
jgi:hypothetical protein